MKWQAKAGNKHRSQVEAQIGRWQQVIGGRLQAGDFDNQTVEAQIASKALNSMTALGRAAYKRVFSNDWVGDHSESKLIPATRSVDIPSAWQVNSGYNQRSRGETQIGRWKNVIGSRLKARSFESQKTEIWVGV